MIEGLTNNQLRKIADTLYDGEPMVAHLISQVRQFKRGDYVLLWLCRNNITGQRLVEFFKSESNDENNHGVLRGVQTALDFIDGRKFYSEGLHTGDLS